MHILHLLSQNHLTGAEVYAAQLILEQKENPKNKVYQVSNGFFLKTKADQQWPLAVETKSKFQFWKNVFLLRSFIRKNRIHVIHTHSRAAAKLAYWARIGLKVGLVSSVHGRQHYSLSKKLWNHYGDFIIPVCENIQKHLIQDFQYNPKRLTVIHNPICNTKFRFLKAEEIVFKTKSKVKIAIVGRTTGPKATRTELVINSLPEILKKYDQHPEFTLIGGEADHLQITDLEIKKNIQSLHIKDLSSEHYADYDLVIGSGRVAVEAIRTGVPTICFGEASYLGLAKPENIHQFIESNFGDIELDSAHPEINFNQLNQDLVELQHHVLTVQDRAQLSEIIETQYNSQRVSKQITRLYESSYFLRNYSKWIPILMYHKIPEAPLETQHKIFVTRENFKKHLQFFKSKNFQTLTFSDIKKFQSAEVEFKNFPKKPLILTFDDGYVDNLKTASPLLKQFGFKAQIFLLANQSIQSNEWDHSETEAPHPIVAHEERQNWKNSSFEIGSHGFNHKKITSLSEPEARHELKNSKTSLEAEFQTPVYVYAFTYGETSPFHAKLAAEEGYDFAVNTDTGGLNLQENPYQIFRVNIFPDETRLSLFKKTSSWYRRYYYFKRRK